MDPSSRATRTPTPASPTPDTPIETKSGPTTIAPQHPPATPLGARLQGMSPAPDGPRRLVVDPPPDEPDPRLQDRQVSPTTPAEAQAGHRRLNVDGTAEVRDPRIVHLADSAALSDDEDVDTPMPPPKVNGVSPDTSFQVANPAEDALVTAMLFNGASMGLGQAFCMALLREPGTLHGLVRTVTRALQGQGFTHVGEVTDAALSKAADDATVALLRARGFPVDQATDRKG